MENNLGRLKEVIVLQGRKAISQEEKDKILPQINRDTVIEFLKAHLVRRTSLAEHVLVEIMASWSQQELIVAATGKLGPEMSRLAFNALTQKMLTYPDSRLQKIIDKDGRSIESRAAQDAYDQKVDTRHRRESLGLPSDTPIVRA